MGDEAPIHTLITDPDFRRAVELLDAGDVAALRRHLDAHPRLLTDPAAFSEGSFPSGMQPGQYFERPKLLWFVAENPIRNGTLPDAIAAVTECIIDRQRAHAPESLQRDLDYALGLVVSGCVARQTGKRPVLIDVLVRHGANPNCVGVALSHRELDAARTLLEHGAELTLAAAAGLGRLEALLRLFDAAGEEARRQALSVAAINGQPDAARFLLEKGLDPNAFNPDGYHAHCTPLHNAVNSGSSEVVAVLLEAGADTTIEDRLFDSDALGWAVHLKHEDIAELIEAARGG